MATWFSHPFNRTDPARRRTGTAVLVGIIGGFFSAIVKFGWEVPFQPRTPERNATNPPQTMLEHWFGMSSAQSHTTVSFNLNDTLPIYGRHETKPYFSWISCAVSDMIGTCRLRSPGKKPPS